MLDIIFNPIDAFAVLRRMVRLASAFAALSATLLTAPAGAQTSDLRGIAWTSNVPTIQQSFTNVEYATLSGVHANDVVGNKSAATGSLATPTGAIALTSHGCSGGGPGFSGQANGGANADITLDYAIVSATLPIGTPVSVSIKWAVNARVTAVGEDMIGVNTQAYASAYCHAVIYINYSPVENRSGTYSTRSDVPDGFEIGSSGTLNPELDSSDHVYTVLVGHVITVFMTGSADSASSVDGGTTDGDVQMAMVWGVSSLNPEASAVLYQSSPSEPAPPAQTATPAQALADLPQRPDYPGILPCCRIPTQPTDVTVCPPTTTASFSVTAQGTGPFSHQWRKSMVPINPLSNASAAAATLTIANAQAADAGPYDCIVTNGCGDVTSNSATLSFLPDLNADGVINAVDLGILLTHFGGQVSPGTLGDVNRDGMVNALDLGMLLGSFGQACS